MFCCLSCFHSLTVISHCGGLLSWCLGNTDVSIFKVSGLALMFIELPTILRPITTDIFIRLLFSPPSRWRQPGSPNISKLAHHNKVASTVLYYFSSLLHITVPDSHTCHAELHTSTKLIIIRFHFIRCNKSLHFMQIFHDTLIIINNIKIAENG